MIELANAEVTKLTESEHVAEVHICISLVHSMLLQTQCDSSQKKYPDLPELKETTVRRLKNL